MVKFPYLSRRSRRLIICRLLACTLTGTICFFLLFPATVSSLPVPESSANVLRRGSESLRSAAHLPTRPEGAKTVEQIALHGQAPSSHHAGSPPRAKPAPKVPDDLPEAVLRLGELLPDEVRMKSLLDPLRSSGEALLRDLAYRVRAFRKAFSAWEALHLIPAEGLHRRQDIVQQLHELDLSSSELVETVHIYDKFRYFVNGFATRLFPWTTPYFGDHMSLHASFYSGGRGIVMTAGDNQARYLLTSIPSFRKLGCTLPIEILYLGDGDLSEDFRERLEALPGVMTRDLSEMIYDKGWTLQGWAAKPFAILMSSFREVLFIDADALFFNNPEELFDDEQYTSTGALFFKDRNLLPESKKKWLKEILPSPISHHVRKNRLWTGESGHMQDSGVVLVDKWRHFVPLLLTTRLNGPDRDGDEKIDKKGVYEMVYGDKETFWLSWELAGELDYAFHESVVGTMGTFKEAQPSKASSADKDKPEEEDETMEKYEDEGKSDEGEEEGMKKKKKDKSEVAGKAASASKTASSNSTIKTVCSAQLLHLSRERRPLWFNGWIEKMKSDEDAPLNLEEFAVYVQEPKELGRRPRRSLWDVQTDNIVCLEAEAERQFTFTTSELDVLDMIMDLARAQKRSEYE